jgi:replication-associated recombination protein RarA
VSHGENLSLAEHLMMHNLRPVNEQTRHLGLDDHTLEADVKQAMEDAVLAAKTGQDDSTSVLITGKAGHGKTSLSKAIFKEAGIPFFELRPIDMTRRKLIAAFDKASTMGAFGILIDFVEAISPAGQAIISSKLDEKNDLTVVVMTATSEVNITQDLLQKISRKIHLKPLSHENHIKLVSFNTLLKKLVKTNSLAKLNTSV